MKKIKMVVAFILLSILCMSAVSCASKSKFVGTWEGSWTYNGNKIDRMFTLQEDGTYSEITYRNNIKSSSETGTYEISGNSVILSPEGESSTTEYTYKNGYLINNDHKMAKQ